MAAPKKEPRNAIPFRLNKAAEKKVRAVAKKEGKSLSDIANELIIKHL